MAASAQKLLKVPSFWLLQLAFIFNFKAANQKTPPHHTAKAPPSSNLCCSAHRVTGQVALEFSYDELLQLPTHPMLCRQLIGTISLGHVQLLPGCIIPWQPAWFLLRSPSKHLLQVPTQSTGPMLRGSPGPPGATLKYRANAEGLPK